MVDILRATIPRSDGVGLRGARPSPESLSSADQAFSQAMDLNDQLQPQLAVAYLRRALELTPGHARAAVELGATLCDVGDPASACEVYEAFLARAPETSMVRMGLASCLLRSGDVEEAVVHYRRCVRDTPTWLEPYPKLIVALCRLGQLAEAREALTRYVDQEPDPRSVKMLEAVLARRSG